MITFVAESHAGSTDTVSKPSGVADGDLLLAFLSMENSHLDVPPTPPAGWTVLYNPTFATDSMWVQVAYKVAASEGSSYTWTHGGSADFDIFMVAYRGTGLSIDVSAKADKLSDDLWDFQPTSNPLYAIPSIAPGFDSECLIAVAVSLHQTHGNYLPVIDGYQDLAGYTRRYMQAGGSPAPAITIQDLIGATCDVTNVLTGIKADDWSDVSFHIGLKESDSMVCVPPSPSRNYCGSVNPDLA